MAIESLAQQTSVFADSMEIRATDADKEAEDNAQEAKTPQQGDTVTISEEARAVIAMEKQSQSGETDEETDMDQTIEALKDQIEQLEQEIKDLEDKDMPEEQKRTQIQDKEVRLMELRDQLVKAQQTKLKLDGQSDGGGTRAQGFGNSAASF